MPTSNAFLIINLGCEMLYVIDQRLKAQAISLEKSAQVLRDITCVLFDQKLIVQLMNPHPCQHILNVQQSRILLTDIACCSLMRLDMTSMDKLWDLMIMLFKWQIHAIKNHPSRLLELTFRHMDGVAKLMPEMKKSLALDSTKRCLIEFWDECSGKDIEALMCKLILWMEPFNVKISILIRSGFQRNDGTFETTPQSHLQDYIDNIGENIYGKNLSKSALKKLSNANENRPSAAECNELSSLASQLNINNDVLSEEPDEEVISDKYDLLVDDVNCSLSEENICSDGKNDESPSEFIHLIKTTTALQSYLEQFQMENVKTNESDTFDATEELLKMLDNNKSLN